MGFGTVIFTVQPSTSPTVFAWPRMASFSARVPVFHEVVLLTRKREPFPTLQDGREPSSSSFESVSLKRVFAPPLLTSTTTQYFVSGSKSIPPLAENRMVPSLDGRLVGCVRVPRMVPVGLLDAFDCMLTT